ncbi:MAG: hypothetical protein AAF570_08725 [Bacteroidota bacterium]
MIRKQLMLTLALLMACAWVLGQKDVGYIYAPSGLNIRATSDPGSAKVGHVKYGDNVKILAPATSMNMTIDGIKGGMAKIQSGDVTGYMFDGYLVPFHQCKPNLETRKYVDELRAKSHDVVYEFHEYDYDGYFRNEYVFILRTDRWAHAFLVAKHLYGIPKGINFPKKGQEKVDNPAKGEFAWEDGMTVERDGSGNLKALVYFWRGEGGGWSVAITKDKDMTGLRIENGQIAD